MRVKIKAIREAKGLTQAVVAKAAGISRPHLAQIESGKRSLTLRNMTKIADALSVSPTELIDFSAPDVTDTDLIEQALALASPEQQQVLRMLAQQILTGQ